ncbi:MAG: molybdopterin-dependent oxidoreductase [Actinomycetota bacterium]
MGRRTNLALLILLPGAVLTGLFANTIGLDWGLDPAMIHGAVALAILLLAPWKSIVVRRGLARPKRRPTHFQSVALLALVLIALTTGLLHSTGLTDHIGFLTVMQVHIGAALLALPLAYSHYRRHQVRLRSTDLGRRAFVRTAGLAASAAVMWAGWEGVARATRLPGANRRFTGSHERGSHRPEVMPVTSWLDDRVPVVDSAQWSLSLAGRSLSLDELNALPHERIGAVLDCTSGWYADQDWSGVRLDRLIDAGERRSLEVRSLTGYSRRFPTRDLDRVWLVTAVGGKPLSPGHGYPARVVAPDRRGFWWVKWVDSIELSDRPWWLQLPFPAT